MLRWLWLSGVVVALDQLSKWWASSTLSYAEPVAVLPAVNLILVHNTGAAFSFLSQAGGWQRWLFVAIALVVAVMLVWWLRALERDQHGLAAALALILGGALGNVWDRLAHGYVIDFIDLYYGRWHWPAFNIADAAITVGVIVLIADALFGGERSGAPG